jgi:hypothetical protein
VSAISEGTDLRVLLTVRLVARTELAVRESVMPGLSWKASESKVAGVDRRVSRESS